VNHANPQRKPKTVYLTQRRKGRKANTKTIYLTQRRKARKEGQHQERGWPSASANVSFSGIKRFRKGNMPFTQFLASLAALREAMQSGFISRKGRKENRKSVSHAKAQSTQRRSKPGGVAFGQCNGAGENTKTNFPHAKPQSTQRNAQQPDVFRPSADAIRFLFWNQAIQKRKQLLNAVLGELSGFA